MPLTVNQRVTVGRNFEQLTVTNSVQVLTPSKYKDSAMSGGAMEAFLTNFGANVLYTYDGTTPTALVGHVLPDGGVLVLRGQNQMAAFKCFRQGSTDSLVSVTYEFE